MIATNRPDEQEFYDQVMHETLTTLTIVSARLQLLRKRVETKGEPGASRVPGALRDLESLIAERAGRLHILAARMPPSKARSTRSR
jgi:hypothetical protein